MIRRQAAILLILCFPPGAQKERACPPPVWSVDLTNYGFRPFGQEMWGDAPHPQGWIQSRGVTFLSPESLAVYEVLPKQELPPLASREPGGGVGRFVLQIQILAAKDGKPVKSLRLLTSSVVNTGHEEFRFGFRSVFPTHDGKFLVRTSDMLRLYSADFVEIARAILPRPSRDSIDDWVFSVSPKSDRIYVEHKQNVGYKDKEPFKTTRYLLDADTLQEVPTLPPRDCPWEPDLWQPNFWQPEYNLSKYKVSEKGGGGGKAPNEIQIASSTGEPVFTARLSGLHGFASHQLTDSFLVAQIFRHVPDPFDLGRCSKPVRLAIYDLVTKSEKCSIPITGEAGHCGTGFLYSVSSADSLAVIQGSVLKVYRP